MYLADGGIQQRTPQWVKERLGCATASRLVDVLDFTKGGKEGAARLQYKIDVVQERITNRAVDHPVTFDMRRGEELEPDARAEYEAATGILVQESGFVLHREIPFFGASPDNYVGVDGLAEYKVPRTSTFLKWIKAGVIPPEHIPQLVGQLSVTRRAWVDFCAYCPDMPEGKRIFVRRLNADQKAIEECEGNVRKFLAEVDQLFDDIMNSVEFVKGPAYA